MYSPEIGPYFNLSSIHVLFKAPQQPNTPVQEDTAEPSSEISHSEFDSDSDGGISVISINCDSETDSAN